MLLLCSVLEEKNLLKDQGLLCCCCLLSDGGLLGFGTSSSSIKTRNLINLRQEVETILKYLVNLISNSGCSYKSRESKGNPPMTKYHTMLNFYNVCVIWLLLH